MKFRFTYIIWCSLYLFFSCDGNQHPVPYVPVEKQINITLPSYSSLQGIGGWTYLDGGSRGIIVYRKTLEDFVAFDRHSTHEANLDCQGVEVDSSNNLIIYDPCSDAKYNITDGSVISGKANYPLRQYNAYFDGTSLLRIYN